MLNDSERERYARHLTLPEVGEEGQEKLRRASVLIIGAGGLGSPSSMYLAAAGVGRIGLVDFDVVDSTNLQRQILYGESVIGQRKLDAAWQRLHDLNRNVRVETFNDRLSSRNALPLFEPYDIIMQWDDHYRGFIGVLDRSARRTPAATVAAERAAEVQGLAADSSPEASTPTTAASASDEPAPLPHDDAGAAEAAA